MRRAARRKPRRRRGAAPLFSIEDGHRVVDRPITSGYRNDAMQVDHLDTGGVSMCPGRFMSPGGRSDTCWNRTLNQRSPRYRAATGKACTRSCGTASPCGILATESGPTCSSERSRAASSASTCRRRNRCRVGGGVTPVAMTVGVATQTEQSAVAARHARRQHDLPVRHRAS
jgi:hypothetical protein